MIPVVRRGLLMPRGFATTTTAAAAAAGTTSASTTGAIAAGAIALTVMALAPANEFDDLDCHSHCSRVCTDGACKKHEKS